ncbi:MAG: hypothetical protein ACO1OQ_03925 [Rufibacter sp.]
MRTTFELAARVREVLLNGTWVANTNYKQQLSELDWKTATARFGSLNTIAVLTQHIHYYLSGIKNVFTSGTLDIKDVYSFDFQPIQSQTAWEKLLENLWEEAEEFACLIEQMPDDKLKQAFVDEKYGTYERNIDGMIEHSYYHLGQIVLLKKIIPQ